MRKFSSLVLGALWSVMVRRHCTIPTPSRVFSPVSVTVKITWVSLPHTVWFSFLPLPLVWLSLFPGPPYLRSLPHHKLLLPSLPCCDRLRLSKPEATICSSPASNIRRFSLLRSLMQCIPLLYLWSIRSLETLELFLWSHVKGIVCDKPSLLRTVTEIQAAFLYFYYRKPFCGFSQYNLPTQRLHILRLPFDRGVSCF